MTIPEPTLIAEPTTKEIAVKILTLVDGRPDEEAIQRAIKIAKDIQADIAAIKRANNIEFDRHTLHSMRDLSKLQVNLNHTIQ